MLGTRRLVMAEKYTKGELHGCIVCGKLYQLYVVKDENGKFIDCKIMSEGAKRVPNAQRPLVACEKHTADQIKAAVATVYGQHEEDDL
jgi:hypothetical protein